MIKKILFILLCSSAITIMATLVMNQDRPASTDFPRELYENYAYPDNRTRITALPSREDIERTCSNIHIENNCQNLSNR